MRASEERANQHPIRLLKALRPCRGVFLGLVVFSALINILYLTGSFYMLQIYDRDELAPKWWNCRGKAAAHASWGLIAVPYICTDLPFGSRFPPKHDIFAVDFTVRLRLCLK